MRLKRKENALYTAYLGKTLVPPLRVRLTQSYSKSDQHILENRWANKIFERSLKITVSNLNQPSKSS